MTFIIFIGLHDESGKLLLSPFLSSFVSTFSVRVWHVSHFIKNETMQSTSEYNSLTQWLLIINNLLSSFLNFAIISDQKHQVFYVPALFWFIARNIGTGTDPISSIIKYLCNRVSAGNTKGSNWGSGNVIYRWQTVLDVLCLLCVTRQIGQTLTRRSANVYDVGATSSQRQECVARFLSFILLSSIHWSCPCHRL